MTTISDKDLLKTTPYKEIVAWGQELSSYDYYIASVVRQAISDNAPLNAIYKRNDGTWATRGRLRPEQLPALYKRESIKHKSERDEIIEKGQF